MQLCKVTGEVWGSRIHPNIEGYKILRVSPYLIESGNLKLSETEILALDTLDAHKDEDVLITSSSGVRNIVFNRDLPIKTITLAVVDKVDFEV